MDICIFNVLYICSSSGYFFYRVLSLNNVGSHIYLILLELVLTPTLHLERLLASLAFSQTLLCSTTAFSEVFFSLPLLL